MKKLYTIIIIALMCLGCNNKCKCMNKNCGPKCKLQCEENRCTPGEKCCDKCTCNPFDK